MSGVRHTNFAADLACGLYARGAVKEERATATLRVEATLNEPSNNLLGEYDQMDLTYQFA